MTLNQRVAGSSPAAHRRFGVDAKLGVSAGISGHPFLGFGLYRSLARFSGDFWRPVSASKNSVPGQRVLARNPTALAAVFPAFAPWGLAIAYSKATPIRKSLRRTTRHGSFNPSSGTTNVNFAGITVASDTSNAAPVIERSRTVQVILSPPCSIWAGFITRWRGAARVSTM
jgi:hypothetical protein